jgi:hypothetical protein
MDFVVCANDFDPNAGGVLCLHALSDCLAELGHSVFLAPLIHEIDWRVFSPAGSIARVVENYCLGMKRPKLSAHGRAKPIHMFEARKLAEYGAFVIYPEITLGNPYRARNVLRWLLHFPMHHMHAMHWGAGDWVVRFNDAVPRIVLPGINFIDRSLKVVKYPIDLYASSKRSSRAGTAYLIRKAREKPYVHPPDAICIDGMSHERAAEILGSVERFYSYDTYTAYSYLAAVAGAVSIVVPDSGRSLEAWYPSVEDRWGVAYGEGMVDWAMSTAHFVQARLQSEEFRSLEDVKALVAHLMAHEEKKNDSSQLWARIKLGLFVSFFGPWVSEWCVAGCVSEVRFSAFFKVGSCADSR